MLCRQRLQTRLKMVLVVMAFVSVFASGCGRVRTVLVPPGEPVRLREPVKKAKVWVADKDGKEVPGEVTVPAGWYALAPEPEAKAPASERKVKAAKPNPADPKTGARDGGL